MEVLKPHALAGPQQRSAFGKGPLLTSGSLTMYEEQALRGPAIRAPAEFEAVESAEAAMEDRPVYRG